MRTGWPASRSGMTHRDGLDVLPAGVGAQRHPQRHRVARPDLVAGQRHADDLGEVPAELDRARRSPGDRCPPARTGCSAARPWRARPRRLDSARGDRPSLVNTWSRSSMGRTPRTPTLVVRLTAISVWSGSASAMAVVSTAEARIGVRRLLRATSARNTRGSAPGRGHPHRAPASWSRAAPRSPTMHDGRSCTTAPDLDQRRGQLERVRLAGDEGVHLAGDQRQVHLADAEHRVAEGDHAVAARPR